MIVSAIQTAENCGASIADFIAQGAESLLRRWRHLIWVFLDRIAVTSAIRLSLRP